MLTLFNGVFKKLGAAYRPMRLAAREMQAEATLIKVSVLTAIG
jgi:hypothetical protein